MKKHLVPLLAALALQPAAAFAEEGGPAWSERLKGLYFGVYAGWNDLSDEGMTAEDEDQSLFAEYDAGWAVSAVAGFADPLGRLRTEFEVAYRENDAVFSNILKPSNTLVTLEDCRLHSLAFMVNMFYDFKNRTDFTPFIGFGAGFARIWEEGTIPAGYVWYRTGGRDYEHSYWHFALQAGGGVSYAVTEHISVEVKYLYYRASPELHSNNIFGGLRFRF